MLGHLRYRCITGGDGHPHPSLPPSRGKGLLGGWGRGVIFFWFSSHFRSFPLILGGSRLRGNDGGLGWATTRVAPTGGDGFFLFSSHFCSFGRFPPSRERRGLGVSEVPAFAGTTDYPAEVPAFAGTTGFRGMRQPPGFWPGGLGLPFRFLLPLCYAVAGALAGFGGLLRGFSA